MVKDRDLRHNPSLHYAERLKKTTHHIPQLCSNSPAVSANTFKICISKYCLPNAATYIKHLTSIKNQQYNYLASTEGNKQQYNHCLSVCCHSNRPKDENHLPIYLMSHVVGLDDLLDLFSKPSILFFVFGVCLNK